MTRRELDKLLDHCGVKPDDLIGAYVPSSHGAAGAQTFRFEPHATRFASDYWVIELREK